MIELLKNKISSGKSYLEKYNLLREELQLLVLKAADDVGLFNNIAFVGGTALRILYGLKRFSEDLYFSLVNSEGFSFSQASTKIEKQLNASNIYTEIKVKEKNTVAVALIKFEKILKELDLSPHKDQKIMLKFECDQNPPAGFNTELSVLTSSHFFTVNHFDKSSLFSGKLHALLCRGHTKGRDYYDFMWYLTNKISPNYLLLNNSLKQTGNYTHEISKANLSELLQEKFSNTDFELVKKDVAPFLESNSELRLFTQNVFLASLGQL